MVKYVNFKYSDDSYIDDIESIIKNFDSYEYISKELSIIIKSIDKDIKNIEFDGCDNIYKYMNIYLHGGIYGFNYDNKNYPLLSCYVEKITIDNVNTIIRFNDVVLDLDLIDVKNFVKIE